MTDQTPGQEPLIALAVITSEQGVLIGRRRDGTPPWTFPGGKVQPGELPVDAAAREAQEETGALSVQAVYEVARQVHPATGHLVVYVAASASLMDGFGTEPDGTLSEVRWASLPEALALMPDMHPPVAHHLAGALQPYAAQRADAAERFLMASWEEMLAAVAAMPDPVQAYKYAARLSAWAEGSNGVGSVSSAVAALKDAQVKRTRDAKRLSLAALGDVLGMSKTRADQAVRRAEGRKVTK